MTYYQPLIYYDDGTNIHRNTPDGLFSWQAFSTRHYAIEWLINNGYDLDVCVIDEYHDNDIENVQIII